MEQLYVCKADYIPMCEMVFILPDYENYPALTAEFVAWDHIAKQYRILKPLPDIFEWYYMQLDYLSFPVRLLMEKIHEVMNTVVRKKLYPLSFTDTRYPYVKELERINNHMDAAIDNLDIFTNPEEKVSFFPPKNCDHISKAYYELFLVFHWLMDGLKPDTSLYKDILYLKRISRCTYKFTRRLPRRIDWVSSDRFKGR